MEGHADAPRERVWALVADGASWSEWARFTKSSLEKEGDPPPDGVGAIRNFGTGFSKSREEVVEFQPPSRFAYRLLKGLPLDDYLAVVTLDEDRGGTKITWHSTFTKSRIPGTTGFYRWFLSRFITDLIKCLAKAAEADQAA